jgi:hypothetical protein
MSRDSDWHVFDKAVELTASAVRGSAGSELAPSYVADLFQEVHRALREAIDEMPQTGAKTGF